MIEYGYTGEAIAKTANGEFLTVHVYDWFATYTAKCAMTDCGVFYLDQLSLA